jgi:hypothetical protein
MSNSSKRETIELWVITVITVVTIVIMFFVLPIPTKQVYDCRLSEISPDFPPEVRNECRKLRAEKV